MKQSYDDYMRSEWDKEQSEREKDGGDLIPEVCCLNCGWSGDETDLDIVSYKDGTITVCPKCSEYAELEFHN